MIVVSSFPEPSAALAAALTKASLGRAHEGFLSLRVGPHDLSRQTVVGPAVLARKLREFIAALDRRTPRPDNPAEAAIARDAAVLRAQAMTRLAEVAAQTAGVPGDHPDRRTDQPRTTSRTPFPAIPQDVAGLSVQEFTFDLDDLDGPRVPSMERICRTFMDDANRALVWWIRFGALQTWCDSPEVMARTTSDARILRDAREVAASFPLNDRWEFDATAFGRTLDGIALKRARTRVDSAASK